MAWQKVCKQGMDGIIVNVNLQNLIPTSFYTTVQELHFSVRKIQEWGFVYFTITYYIIPTLFAYCLACHPYILFYFLQ